MAITRNVIKQYYKNDREFPLHQSIWYEGYQRVMFVCITQPGEEGNDTGEPQVTCDLLETEYRGVDPEKCVMSTQILKEAPSWNFGHPDKAETYDALIGFLRTARDVYKCIIANTATGVLLDLVPEDAKTEDGTPLEVLEDEWNRDARFSPEA